MVYKRLRSGKYINSGEMADLSFSAKEQIFESVRNQFVETIKLPAEYSDVSDNVNSMGYSILRISRNLNEYCEIISGKCFFRKEKMEIAKTFLNLCEASKEFFKKKNINLVFKTESENIFVKTDREKFYYAVLNVLLNAAENTPRGGKVRVVLSRTKKFAKIAISDNGTGMDEETVLHCFEPFFSKSGYLGKPKMGIGLTLAHWFVSENKGRIHISSEKGKGTTVYMLIPLLEKEEADLSVEAPVPDILGGKFSPVSIMLSGIEKE